MISPATAGPVGRSWIDLEALFFAHGSRPPSCSCVWSRRCSFRLAACRRHGLSRPNSPSTRHQEAATSPYLLPGSRSGAERDSRVRRRSRGAAAAAARYGRTCWTWAASASSSGRLSPALPISQEPRSWSPSPPSEEPHPIPRRISVAGEELPRPRIDGASPTSMLMLVVEDCAAAGRKEEEEVARGRPAAATPHRRA